MTSDAGAPSPAAGHAPRAPIDPIPPERVREARERLRGVALRTPLIPLETSAGDVYLKLECLQPIGSFKVRGAANAMLLAGRERLRDGVYTASAGNMAQGVAFVARRFGVRCRVIVPETAPRAKLDAIARLGGEAIPVPFDEWWRAIVEHGHPDERGFFIHPVADPAVIAGNATIGLELTDDLPDVRSVLVPFGGGGLACGIAAALRERAPAAAVYACEVETAAPLAAALEAGRPVAVDHRPSFVDGIGGKSVLPEMWPLARQLLAGALVVGLDEIAAAVRLLAVRAHVVAEGAGAAPVAAALAGDLVAVLPRPIVCVVSGGNIDPDRLATILAGAIP